MRQFIYACLLLFIVGCKDKKQAAFEVSGSIKNSGASVVYLEEASIGSQPVVVDSASLDKEGKFELDALSGEETIYNLRLDNSGYPFVSFINDSKKISIQADLKNQQVYSVEGSPASQALKDFLYTSGEKLRALYNHQAATDSLQQKGISDSLLAKRQAEHARSVSELKSYTTDFVTKSNSPALSIFALGTYQSMAANPSFSLESFTEEEVKNLMQQTATKFPDHKGLALINNSLKKSGADGATAGNLLNRPAPDFTLPDVNGNPVSLSSFKGKYVLVDFWASWCRPCRLENPNVVNAYQKFKDKNFTVLGVSLDRPGAKDEWVKAIKDDNLAWTHVSDLKFWESSVVGLYGIEGIPYNVLVDPSGKVIAESLRGEDLEQKLSEVLQ